MQGATAIKYTNYTSKLVLLASLYNVEGLSFIFIFLNNNFLQLLDLLLLPANPTGQFMSDTEWIEKSGVTCM